MESDEEDALPFSGSNNIEYGSLGAYPPYVPTPPTALKNAIDLASNFGLQNNNKVVEVGCGKGEFIQAIYRNDWNSKCESCMGIDINEELI